jgi:hypothetical protein
VSAGHKIIKIGREEFVGEEENLRIRTVPSENVVATCWSTLRT